MIPSKMIPSKRIVALLALLAGIAVLVGAPRAAQAANLLTNPGFESWTTATSVSVAGTGTLPVSAVLSGWTCVLDNYNSTIGGTNKSKAAWPAYDGSITCGMFHAADTGSVHSYAYQDINALPNHDYLASVQVRTAYVAYSTLRAFGTTSTDSAGLRVLELADDGTTVTADHGKVDVKVLTNYLYLFESFTTQPNTAKVRYMLDSQYNCTYAYVSSQPKGSWIQYDGCVLDDSPAPATISGTVTSGGTGLEGVTVYVTPQASAVTGPTGAYSFSCPVALGTVAIRASMNGYFAQKKYRALAPGTMTVNFDIVPVGSNLLKNAGFDDNASHTPYTSASDFWTIAPGSTPYRESLWLDAAPPAYIKSGEEAATLLSTAVPQECMVYQTASVQPSSLYTARAWAKAVGGPSWGTDPNQKAALYIQETDRTGNVTEHKEYLSNFSDWQHLEYSWTSGSTAIMVRVACWANLVDDYNATTARVVFDDVELNGPVGSTLPSLFGVVKSGATPLSGAYVELSGTAYNTTTASDGYWSFNAPTRSYTIRAIGNGYYTQQKVRSAPNTTPIIFNLVATGNNILFNAGIDEGWPLGWNRLEGALDGRTSCESFWNTVKTATYCASGEEASAIQNYRTNSSDGEAWAFQDVAVVAGEDYVAKVKFRPAWNSGTTSVWGSDPAQTAALFVQEYDASGSPVGTEKRTYATLADMNNWETLQLPFTPATGTARVHVGGYAYMIDDMDLDKSRAIFDDFELNGPIPTFSLGGTVTCGATPIAGALVEVMDNSAPGSPRTTHFTQTDGAYTVPEAQWAHNYAVRISKGGCYAQIKNKVVNGVVALNFDLRAVGSNLLPNAGFDDYPISGLWAGQPFAETNVGLYANMLFCSGEQASDLRVLTAGATSWMGAVLPVMPTSPYTVRVKFRPGYDSRFGSSWLTNPNQKASLWVDEYDALGAQVGARRYVWATVTSENIDQWQTLEVSFTSAGSTATMEIGAYVVLTDVYSATLGRAIYDDFELNGPVVPGSKIAAVKAQADGSTARMTGEVVTASFDGFFYVEESDRTSGIRVNGTAQAGDAVDVTGTVSTVNGERVITNATLFARSTGPIPAPLGLNNRDSGYGLSAVGLYVVMWGTVDSVGTGFFTMTDGSGTSLKVYGSATLNDYVRVAGALGAELSGATPVPVLRAVSVAKKD